MRKSDPMMIKLDKTWVQVSSNRLQEAHFLYHLMYHYYILQSIIGMYLPHQKPLPNIHSEIC